MECGFDVLPYEQGVGEPRQKLLVRQEGGEVDVARKVERSQLILQIPVLKIFF